MRVVFEPVRDLLRLWGEEGDTVPPRRRGPVFVGVQVLAVVALVALFLLVRTLLSDGGGAVGGGPAETPAGVFVGAWASIPLFVHWFVGPPRRGPGLAAGLVAGVAAGLVAGASIGPAFGLPDVWVGFAATALGVLGCGVVFAWITVAAADPSD